jgi:hypothetical protein
MKLRQNFRWIQKRETINILIKKYIAQTFPNIKLQRKLLYVINMGQGETDNSNQPKKK